MPAAVTRCAVTLGAGRISDDEDGGQGQRGLFPLTFAPAEASQFDWSEKWIILDGIAFKAQVAHARLCHSRMPYIRASHGRARR